jgi:hypothetical protein
MAPCELSPTCASQASATEGYALPPVVRGAWMTGLTPPDFPINAETLIGEARAARERQADEQVVAHIRGVVSRLKSHKPKGDAHALR